MYFCYVEDICHEAVSICPHEKDHFGEYDPGAAYHVCPDLRHRLLLLGKHYGKEEWFKEVIEKGRYISDVFLGYRRIPHFIIALAREEEGEKWVIRATIDTHMFNDLVKKVRIGRTGESYILNTEGIFQTERRSGGNLMDKDPENIKYPRPQEGIKTFIKKVG